MVSHGGTPTWRLYTGLCKFVQNISTNIWSLGKRTDLKLGEMSYLFISYIIISWLYTLNQWFSNYFFIAWQCKPRIAPTCERWNENLFYHFCLSNCSLQSLQIDQWTDLWYLLYYLRNAFIENDHLGDRKPEKDCCWRLTFRQPVRKASSEWTDSFSQLKIQKPWWAIWLVNR